MLALIQASTLLFTLTTPNAKENCLRIVLYCILKTFYVLSLNLTGKLFVRASKFQTIANYLYLVPKKEEKYIIHIWNMYN